MLQQVNLYQLPERGRFDWMTLSALLTLGASMAVGLLTLSMVTWMQNEAMEKQVIALQTVQTQGQARLAEFTERHPRKQASRALASKLEVITAEHTAMEKIMAAITDSASANRQGFSGYLSGLARQRTPDLWLTGFELADGGRFMRIAGNTTSPESVPVFLQRLGQESLFQGREFYALNMERQSNETRDWIAFSVQTAEVEE